MAIIYKLSAHIMFDVTWELLTRMYPTGIEI